MAICVSTSTTSVLIACDVGRLIVFGVVQVGGVGCSD